MIIQRDRLAIIVGEAALAEMERQGASKDFTWSNVADALFARGVRVVDVETLAFGLHRGCAVTFSKHAWSDCPVQKFYLEDAAQILAKIDRSIE